MLRKQRIIHVVFFIFQIHNIYCRLQFWRFSLVRPVITDTCLHQHVDVTFQNDSPKVIFKKRIPRCTSTRQKIRIFWKIAITFLTLAQNPFNYSKRFNIILEINEGKLVHNYGNFNYKYMYFLKKCIFLRIFI